MAGTAVERLHLHMQLLAQVHDAVVAIDDDERVTFWGRGAVELYGVGEQEALGAWIRDLYRWRWRSPDAQRAAYACLERDGYWRGENEHVLRSGQVIQVESTVSVLCDAQGRRQGLLAVIRDVSERLRVEREHEANEARLRVALGLIDMAVFSQDRDLRYTWVYRPQLVRGDDVIGKTDFDFLGQLGISGIDDVIGVKRRALESGVGVREEIRLVEGDGVHWYDLAVEPTRDDDGHVMGLTAASLEVTERKRAEQELRASREQLRALAMKLQSVREEENARIARDLHDELGQLLTAIKMHLRPIERALGNATRDRPEVLLDHVVAASEVIDQTITTVQRIAVELRPGTLDRLGLAAALTEEARRFQERTGIACETRLADQLPPLAPEAATALYRICQEAMTNVCRHARATRVQLRLEADALGVRLQVEDDGCGFDAAAVRERPALGLLGMAERARALGGSAELLRAGDRGTIVSAWLPLDPAPSAGHIAASDGSRSR